MRPAVAAFALASAAALVACSGNTAPADQPGESPAPTAAERTGLPDTLTIPLGGTLRADAGRLSVTFAAKLTDSRCPANAMCVWEGDASVRLTVRAGGRTADTVIHTRTAPTAVAVAGYVLSVPGLMPYPGTWPDGTPEPSPTVMVAVARHAP